MVFCVKECRTTVSSAGPSHTITKALTSMADTLVKDATIDQQGFSRSMKAGALSHTKAKSTITVEDTLELTGEGMKYGKDNMVLGEIPFFPLST